MTQADGSRGPGPGAWAPPRPAGDLVVRGTVLDRLSAPGVRVAVITAPAGYGKTSHAAAWLASDDRPVAWIDVGIGHDDAPVLARELVDALATVTDIDFSSLSAGPLTPDQYSTQFAAALGRAVRSSTVPFVLVVDDVHRLSDLTALDLLSAVVADVPAGSVVVLVGRACPLEHLGRLRVGRAVVEIGASELGLDPDEVGAVLAGMGVPVSATLLDDVVSRTEGWPVGVRLAGLASIAPPGEEADGGPISGREISVAEYLESEWLWGLTADEREVLTYVSPLEWLSGPLCNQVLDRNDAGEVLHGVFRDRLLLIPLDRRGEAYRMHGLLRDALQAQFERTDAAGSRRVHLRASAWFEAAGDVDRAVHHAVAAGDVDLAERLVVAWSPAAYANGHYTTVRRWIDSIPRERVVESAALCLCAALTAMGRTDAAELGVWLRLGEHADHSDEMSRLGLRYLRSTTNIGPVRPALEDAAVAYAGLPPGIWHAGSCLAYGVWSWTLDTGDPVAILAEGAEEASVLGAPVAEAYCTAMSALIAHAEGDPERAWALGARAHSIAADHGLLDAPGMAIVSSVQALHCASTGDQAAAREAWQRSRTQLAQLKDLSGWANVQARVALARASLLLGDRAGAETVLVEARGFLVRQPDAVRAISQVDEVSELVAQMKHQVPGGSSSLTTAELRVLHYLPTNLTLAAIGSRLFISRYTVKTHCEAIYRKLDASSRAEAVDTARRLGLLTGQPADD
ncbi:MAG: LuxR C-terminal-related transcriptional regulator [Acidimicrobiales bacterium]|jgi:LuxR family maltose regulon positive regulatory protein|nr:LuxR C-terminal-related transcriptional regulator [Acidimicrobiales bacterium]